MDSIDYEDGPAEVLRRAAAELADNAKLAAALGALASALESAGGPIEWAASSSDEVRNDKLRSKLYGLAEVVAESDDDAADELEALADTLGCVEASPYIRDNQPLVTDDDLVDADDVGELLVLLVDPESGALFNVFQPDGDEDAAIEHAERIAGFNARALVVRVVADIPPDDGDDGDEDGGGDDNDNDNNQDED